MPIVALLIGLLLLFIALALDIGRVHLIRGQLQAALDAAALAAAGESVATVQLVDGVQKTIFEVQEEAARSEGNRVFAENVSAMDFAGQGVTVVSTGISLPAANQVKFTAEVRVKTFLLGPMMQLMGNDGSFRELQFERSATAEATP